MTKEMKQHWRMSLALLLIGAHCSGESFRIATYNLESYLDVPTKTRPVKSQESKAKVRESIRAIEPDVLALQELGSASALLELRDSLKSEGVDLPNWQLISGSDTNIHLGLLSRFPFAASRPHTNESYLLNGRRFHVSRGFAEVDIQVRPDYSFTLIAAHFKSRRALAEADEEEMRLEEAKLLREKIDAQLQNDPQAKLVVLGDFNDTKDSPSTKVVMGRGKTKLVDTRPAERNGDGPARSGTSLEQRYVTWTHYYAKEDNYSRIDFVLLSRAMAQDWATNRTYVLTLPNWGLASDHRPIVATFEVADR
jgi:endonuclease/exonuclease/phosphatase family metal-dependent hydrolase